MTAKNINKSIGYVSSPVRARRRAQVTAGIVVPADAIRHLVAAAAYFRAARYRAVGVEGCRSDDQCAAAMELEALLRRHNIKSASG